MGDSARKNEQDKKADNEAVAELIISDFKQEIRDIGGSFSVTQSFTSGTSSEIIVSRIATGRSESRILFVLIQKDSIILHNLVKNTFETADKFNMEEVRLLIGVGRGCIAVYC